MNDIHEHLDHDHQPPAAPDAATPEPVGVPEAVQAAAVAERRAANAAKKTPLQADNVVWMRASDVMARTGAILSKRGINAQEARSRRVRSAIVAGARAVGRRVRRLPPLRAFGRNGTTPEPVARSGVGMA